MRSINAGGRGKWDAKIEIESILKQMPKPDVFLGVCSTKMVGDKQQNTVIWTNNCSAHADKRMGKKNLYPRIFNISSKKLVT